MPLKPLQWLRYDPPKPPKPIPPPPAANPYQPPNELPTDLDAALQIMDQLFHAPANADYLVRRFLCGGVECAVLHIDGMTDREVLEDVVLRAMQNAMPLNKVPGKSRAQALLDDVLPTGTGEKQVNPMEIADFILGGNLAIIMQGCGEAVLCEMQGFAKRAVEKPVTEDVIIGPHQAFNESIRVNLALLRRILRTPDLVNEMVTVGRTAKNKLSICYLSSLTNPELIAEVKRRVEGIDVDTVYSAGELAQLIEDKPMALMPQLMLTERPDRAASFLMEGMVILLYDNSPFAIGAPVTVSHFLHSSEDTFLRWQYGTFMRIVRLLGLMLALFLPALYTATLLYHQELLPAELLTSLLEGHAMVPFSVTTELLLMELTFNLINEANLRIPGYMGSTLGIVGALVLGQAAVSASLISPALIIVVSVAGLGTFAVPSYPMSLVLRIRRLGYILAGAFFGFAGIAVLALAFLIADCALESFGVPFFAPFAPTSGHNPDLITRLPIAMQRKTPAAFKAKRGITGKDPRGWQNN